MNTVVTSKEAILTTCRQLVKQNGIGKLNMRQLAKECDVAVGSLYNYFPSKEDLILAVVEDIWLHIFHSEQMPSKTEPFLVYIEKLYEHVMAQTKDYEGFFSSHTEAFSSKGKSLARCKMEQYQEHMEEELLQVLQQDSAFSLVDFDDKFTPHNLVHFVLGYMIFLWTSGSSSCQLLTEIIKRILHTSTTSY